MTLVMPTAEEIAIHGGGPIPPASQIASPIKMEPGDEPRVLVRRNIIEHEGPDGEQIFVQRGQSLISIFTGIGGIDIGAEWAGMMTVCQVEMEDICCQTLIANHENFYPDSALIQGDITQVPTSMILRESGLLVGEAFMVAGGPPCQGFSTAGRRDPKDPRNNLIFEFCRVVREAQPKYFVMENVPGLPSMKKGWFLKEFLDQMHAAYYEIVYGLINAVEFGVPQTRTRLFCMGTRRDIVENDHFIAPLPNPTHFGKEGMEILEDGENRPILLEIPEEADLFRQTRQCYGIRHFPDRDLIVPVAPLSRGCEGRSKKYMKLRQKLEKSEPDRVIVAE